MHKQLMHLMQGDYRSVFKGSGLAFDDIRPYQYGDEVRSINWKLSAKGHGTYVNTFIEEREQTVFFLLDVSGSQEVGAPTQQKIDIGKEICSVLAFSAARQQAQVGILCFSDQKEVVLPPNKGLSHVHRVVNALYRLRPASKATDLSAFLLQAAQIIKKKSLVVFVSDFIGENYHKPLAFLGEKHDVIAIDLVDTREKEFPKLGMLPLIDRESGQRYWVDTASKGFKKTMKRALLDKKEDLERFCTQKQVHYLRIHTADDYVPLLVALFKRRNHGQGRHYAR